MSRQCRQLLLSPSERYCNSWNHLLPLPSLLITGVLSHAWNLSGLASISVIQKRTASAERVVDTLNQCFSWLPKEPLAPGVSSLWFLCIASVWHSLRAASGKPACCTAACISAGGLRGMVFSINTAVWKTSRVVVKQFGQGLYAFMTLWLPK